MVFGLQDSIHVYFILHGVYNYVKDSVRNYRRFLGEFSPRQEDEMALQNVLLCLLKRELIQLWSYHLDGQQT